jgi:hypothetical protein
MADEPRQAEAMTAIARIAILRSSLDMTYPFSRWQVVDLRHGRSEHRYPESDELPILEPSPYRSCDLPTRPRSIATDVAALQV